MPRPVPNAFLVRLLRYTRRQLHRFRAAHPKVVHRCLCGACAIGSLLLYNVLRRLGYEVSFVLGWFKRKGGYCPHAWLLAGRRIVDVTATQFGLPAVFITHVTDERYVPWGRDDDAIERANRWGLGQAPITYTSAIESMVMRTLERFG